MIISHVLRCAVGRRMCTDAYTARSGRRLGALRGGRRACVYGRSGSRLRDGRAHRRRQGEMDGFWFFKNSARISRRYRAAVDDSKTETLNRKIRGDFKWENELYGRVKQSKRQWTESRRSWTSGKKWFGGLGEKISATGEVGTERGVDHRKSQARCYGLCDFRRLLNRKVLYLWNDAISRQQHNEKQTRG